MRGLSLADLDKLEALLAAMTPAPWAAHHEQIRREGRVIAELRGVPLEDDGPKPETVYADGPGIVTLRNVAPELIAVARAARHVSQRLAGGGTARRFDDESLSVRVRELDAKLAEVLGDDLDAYDEVRGG
jgi:hypothetical protein